jgi:uncharacterized protein involved in copper resistance
MTSLRRAAVVLALAAMMLRALMPAGWMPNPAGASESLFIICDMDQDMPGMDMSHMSAADMAQMDMPGMDHGSSGKHSMDGHQQACPFGAAPHVATSSNLVALLLPSRVADFAAHRAQARVAADTASYTPQSPRAPPVTV